MEYKLIRSRRRTVALEITGNGEVLVRAPLHMSAQMIQRFVSEHEAWIHAHIAKAQLKAERYPEPDEAQRLEYINMAKRVMPERVEYYSRVMGLYPTAIKITGAKARFGSCSGRDSICFSWRLMQYPPEAVDYVVVHELAHIKYKNHGREFYDLIFSVLPDYKHRSALLK